MIFRRGGRFDDLVRRQLDLFAVDEADLLHEADEADRAWTDAGRDRTEELYGDYQLVVDVIADRLLEIRSAYGATLGDDARPVYEASFNREATKRFRRYGSLLADLDE